ncbi:MAG: hypothetical protein IH986_18200 [Planctomycetes bacterium]|nr:hypothetical protein [Planctomycetota bacterium]
MTQHAQQQGTVDNEFDAAKAIVETLKGLDKEKQERAMRFASETLGLHAPAVSAGRGTPPPAGQGRVHGEEIETSPPGRTVNIKQFTESKAPKTDQQFAAVVAYYYRFEAPAKERKEAIGVNDLLEAVRLAERKRPGTPLSTLNNAKNKGYLDAAGRAKFQINSVGENLVAMTLPGKDRSTPSRRKGGNTTQKKKGKAPAKKRGRARK